jgi:LEA14-like dessication related protein
MKKLFTILFLSLSLMACNSGLINTLVESPEIKGIQLKSFSIADKRVIFDINLYNPNPFPLPISSLNGNFKLNQLAIGSIAAETEESLAAQTTQIVTLPISFDTDALIDAAQSVFSKQEANYHFSGGIDTAVGQLPFSKKGALSVTDVIKALLP